MCAHTHTKINPSLFKYLSCLFSAYRIAPEGVDVVLDCLCGEECNRGYSLLKPMGKYILYGIYMFNLSEMNN